MGAVVSCIKSVFQAIGACLMAVVNGIGSALQAIIAGIVNERRKKCGIVPRIDSGLATGSQGGEDGARSRFWGEVGNWAARLQLVFKEWRSAMIPLITAFCARGRKWLMPLNGVEREGVFV
ncbi:MAG: hypothetical protein Q9217_000649 [Psora testacea]